MTLPVSCVLMRADDRPFVLHTWLRSYRSSPWVRGVDSTVYYKEHHALAQALLDRSMTWVAAWDKDPTQVYGWVCGDRIDDTLVVHYIYVKGAFRRSGIARMLMSRIGYAPGETIEATHRTWVDGDDGFAAKVLRFDYNPYRAYKVAYGY